MDKPIRILHVLNGLGTGGAEAMIMNWYRHIDREVVQFDFLVRSVRNVFADEIASYGGRVFVMPPYPSQYFANKRETDRFFAEHGKEYAGIHVHGNALLYVNVFPIAKRNGINLRIFHSHSTSTSSKYLPLHIFNRLRIDRMATDFLACSKAAGAWAFRGHDYTVINNGVMTEHLVFDENKRKLVRNQLKIADETVYGHIGRFEPVKNHVFLLEVFEKILQKDENSILLLLGDGKLVDQIKEMADQKKIAHKVRFAGRQKEVGDFLSAMDVFLLPSHHEGLGIVAVEAQASGLPCLLSDTIPHEVELTNLVKFLPISDPDVWVETALNMNGTLRRNTQEEIVRAGYDIKQSTQFLEKFYCSKYDRYRGK